VSASFFLGKNCGKKCIGAIFVLTKTKRFIAIHESLKFK
jgi:hypothetical protein